MTLWTYLCVCHFTEQKNNYTSTIVKGVLLTSTCLQHLFHSLIGRCLMSLLNSDIQEPLLCWGLPYNSMPITKMLPLAGQGRQQWLIMSFKWGEAELLTKLLEKAKNKQQLFRYFLICFQHRANGSLLNLSPDLERLGYGWIVHLHPRTNYVF